MIRAVTLAQYGPASNMTVEMQPCKKPAEDQVLIQVRASSVNPIDWKIRNGSLRLISGIMKPPKQLGSDFAGEIIECGQGVTGFRVGDAVFGFINPLTGGAYADQLCLPSRCYTHMPSNLSFSEAATLPLAALTAYQALYHIAKLKPKQTVAINGCSGGVGVMATQIATALGARVIGICSQKNHALAHQLGATETIDYTAQKHLSSNTLCDVFFDVIGNRHQDDLSSILKPKGCYITTLPNIKTTLLSCFTQKKHVLAKPNSKDLLAICNLVNSHKLRAIIDETFSIEDIAKAHEKSEGGRTVGKISITMPLEL